MSSLLFAWFSFSPMEIMIVGVVILLVFGSRLPSVMRSLGQGVSEFKKGISDTDNERIEP